MVRKSIVSLLLVLLLTLGCTCAFAVSAVVDGAGLFTADEIGRMEKVIEQIRSKYKVDAYVLTTYDFPSGLTDKQIQDRVDVWYEQNGCGIGSDRAGVVYAIDMSNRASVISTAGVMIDYLDDDRKEDIQDYVYDNGLSSGRYGAAGIAAMERVMDWMRKGRERGQFRYDETTGERLSGLYNPLTIFDILIALGAGGAVALIFGGSVKGGYALKGGTYVYNVAEKVKGTFIKDEEQFLRQSTHIVRRPPPQAGGGHSSGGSSRPHGGSGVHVSSGGMSHGGSVRRF